MYLFQRQHKIEAGNMGKEVAIYLKKLGYLCLKNIFNVQTIVQNSVLMLEMECI